jgi:hypothetical protein
MAGTVGEMAAEAERGFLHTAPLINPRFVAEKLDSMQSCLASMARTARQLEEHFIVSAAYEKREAAYDARLAGTEKAKEGAQ